MALPTPGGPLPVFGPGYQSRGQDSPDEMPPFLEQEECAELRLHSGQHVKAYIDAKAEKGFFLSSHDKVYTCYRRNYLSIGCGYRLDPLIPNDPLYVHSSGRNGTADQVQALAMTLTAAVDGAAGKAVDLVQHTPKRDKGPQSAIRMIKMCPVAGQPGQGHMEHHVFGSTGSYPLQIAHNAPQPMPMLPLQNAPDPEDQAANHHAAAEQSHGGPGSAAFPGPPSPTSTAYTFERIQFKSATANNGKRRAQQQYYHLIIELHADVRQPGAEHPVWVKIAQRTSAPVVVRGRSPSHYSEGHGVNHHQGRGAGAGGAGDKGSMPFGWPHGMGGPHMGYSTGGQYGSLGGSGRWQYHIGAHGGPRPMLGATAMRSSPSGSSSSSMSEEEHRAPEYSYYTEPLVDAGITSPRARHEISLPSLSSFGLLGSDSSRGMYPWANGSMAVDQAY
jgi:meiosis-specific transcription factor NDT80